MISAYIHVGSVLFTLRWVIPYHQSKLVNLSIVFDDSGPDRIRISEDSNCSDDRGGDLILNGFQIVI